MNNNRVYKPTPANRAIATAMDQLTDLLMQGEIRNVGVCATRQDGTPVIFYSDESREQDMMQPLSMLIGLYRANQKFRRRITAPRNNRSYLAH